MDKSKTVLREGYIYREEVLHGQADVLYCVLKPNTLNFHRRKVHKRHTPLGSLKLEELTVDILDNTNYECIGLDAVDCNRNVKRFPWIILSGKHKLYLYCADLEDRTGWVEAIKLAKSDLTSEVNCEDLKIITIDHNDNFVTRAKEQRQGSEDKGSVDNLQLLSPKSVDNSTHSVPDNTVRKDNDLSSSEPKNITRIRSRSLSEVEKTDDVILDSEHCTRHMKSKSAPPDGGKRGCKTVDKLKDVHSGLCRQFVKWI